MVTPSVITCLMCHIIWSRVDNTYQTTSPYCQQVLCESIIDIITCLYGKVLNINARNPKDPRRDKFVLSKGHGVAALYVVLSEMGFFPESELKRYCSMGGILGEHPDSTKVPGIEASTGSLGHGFSVAVGFALANKIVAEVENLL